MNCTFLKIVSKNCTLKMLYWQKSSNFKSDLCKLEKALIFLYFIKFMAGNFQVHPKTCSKTTDQILMV